MDPDYKEVVKVGVPTFNTMTFFDVSEERFVIPHVVTEVAAEISNPRIALTGWVCLLACLLVAVVSSGKKKGKGKGKKKKGKKKGKRGGGEIY